MSDSNRSEQKKFDIFAPLRGIFHKYDDEDDEEMIEADFPEGSDNPASAVPEQQTAQISDPEPTEKVIPRRVVPKQVPVRKTSEAGEPGGSGSEVRFTGSAAVRVPEKIETEEKEKNKLGSLFGKFVEIITQPEDGNFPEDDENVLDDIFAGEDVGGAEEKKRSVTKATAASSLYKEKSRTDGEKVQAEEKEDEDVSVSFAQAEPIEAEEKEVVMRPETAPEPAAPAMKTEITIDAIMQAKNSAVTKTPMTYKGILVSGNSTEQAESSAEAEAENEVQTTRSEQSTEKHSTKVKVHAVSKGKKNAAEAEQGKSQEEHEKHDIKEEALTENGSAAESTDEGSLSAEKHKEISAQPENSVGAVNAETEKTENDEDAAENASEPTTLYTAPPAVEEKTVPTQVRTVRPVSPPVIKPTPRPPVQSAVKLPRPVQPSAAPVREHFAQVKAEPMVYHSHDGIPFVVMAGKFSKTIRAEYELARKFRALAAPEAQAGPAPAPAAGAVKHSRTEKAVASSEKQAEKKPVDKTAASDAAAAAAVAVASVVPAEKKVKPKPPIKFPKKKKPVGSGISGLFSGDDEFDEAPFEEEKARPELDDYKSEDEADEIRSDINENLRNVFVRTVALTVTTVTAIITALLAYFMPALFTTIIHHGWLVYAAINLALLLVSVYFDRLPVYNGLMSLLRFKGDSDTAAAVAVVAVTVQTIFALFLPDVFVNGTYHIYVPLVILALLLNSVGKLLIIKRTADNFRFLCKKEARFAGKIYTNIDNAEKLVRDLPFRKPIIAYAKRSDFMSNFLRLSYAVDPVEDLARMIAPFTACLSLLCGIAYGAVTRDFVGGVSSFALTSVITIPMCALLAINLPMKNLSGSVLSKGAMLSGYESVKQFSDTNTVMLDYTDLYPKGSIILSGIKAFSETKIQDAILAGAAVTFAVNGSMTYIFETMIQDRQNMLPKVESVTYDDNMGLSGWIGGQRILIGNRELLKKHNITPPNERLERKYLKMGNEISYISVGGELVAMFIMTYKADRGIAESLRELEDNGVSFVVRTIDPNITAKHIAEKFSLYSRCVTVLRTGMGTIAYDEISGKEKTSRAYLVTNGKIEAFASAVSGCIKMRSAVTISKIIQMLSIVIGFVLVNILSFFSGFAKLGVFELLLYIGFWCIALIAVSVAARKIS